MNSLIKPHKHPNWFIKYTDADGRRRIINSGIPHSPVGIDVADTKRKIKENRDKARMRIVEMEESAKHFKHIYDLIAQVDARAFRHYLKRARYRFGITPSSKIRWN